MVKQHSPRTPLQDKLVDNNQGPKLRTLNLRIWTKLKNSHNF